MDDSRQIGADGSAALTVGELFDQQVRLRPDATAVRTAARSWTYAEFGRETARLAHRLSKLGAGPGKIVGMPIPRGPAALVGLVAAMRSGAACLPLDPDDPPARNAEVLRDVGCEQILALSRDTWLPGVQLLDDPSLRDEPTTSEGLPVPAPQDLAYAITTSGSTGRPKVVGVPHAGIVNLILASRDDLDLIRPDDVVLWTSPATVDITMQDCLMALCCGGAVAIPEQGDLPATRIVHEARTLGATVLDIPAAMVGPYGGSLLPRLAKAGVRLVAAGSSQLDGRGLAEAAGAMVVQNCYGPTEASVAVTWYRCLPSTPQRAPIGKPIRNVRTHVLDDELRQVPVGEVGQLYLGGPALARGYLGLPARTAAAFLPDPYAPTPGERMYATGDRVLRQPDGDLVFLGRIDDQVKINGFRVETGEVEHALRQCPGVADAAMLVREDTPGGTAVVAFLAGTPSADEVLVRRLRERLPGHMVPRFYVWLDELPLNRPGKVDRAALAKFPVADLVYRGRDRGEQAVARPQETDQGVTAP
ncbi:amino acid adenylation domain-containing protein [Actinokineospora inagensis]|uniref:amino acid adenylation domain-containing protein n=1 Tax=Actinokineospora inagensis TaxID=103730 RepID=UPI000409E3DB|nr:amino acid adenylation domain-containing protein [Actinokineospora inagensis]